MKDRFSPFGASRQYDAIGADISRNRPYATQEELAERIASRQLAPQTIHNVGSETTAVAFAAEAVSEQVTAEAQSVVASGEQQVA